MTNAIAERLIDGNRRYLSAEHNPGDISPALRRETAENGQRPHSIVICCSDSRVVPESIFSAGLGELFVIRVAAAFEDCARGAVIGSPVPYRVFPVVAGGRNIYGIGLYRERVVREGRYVNAPSFRVAAGLSQIIAEGIYRLRNFFAAVPRADCRRGHPAVVACP